MGIDWLQYAVLNRQKYRETMDRKIERYIYWCLQMWGASYGWGKEVIWSTDCSGLVCSALAGMGYRIRTTANALMQKVFVFPSDNKCDEVKAAFFVDPETDRAVHVGAIVGDGVLLHAVEPEVRLQPLEDVVSWFGSMGKAPHVRKIDWSRALVVSEAREEFWDPDEEFSKMFFSKEA